MYLITVIRLVCAASFNDKESETTENINSLINPHTEDPSGITANTKIEKSSEFTGGKMINFNIGYIMKVQIIKEALYKERKGYLDEANAIKKDIGAMYLTFRGFNEEIDDLENRNAFELSKYEEHYDMIDKIYKGCLEKSEFLSNELRKACADRDDLLKSTSEREFGISAQINENNGDSKNSEHLGNLLKNLQSEKQNKLLEFDATIKRIGENINDSKLKLDRLSTIKVISLENFNKFKSETSEKIEMAKFKKTETGNQILNLNSKINLLIKKIKEIDQKLSNAGSFKDESS